MKEQARQRNTSGLAAYAKQRAEQKLQKVDHAITTLIRENKPVNFNTVARVAGVTKAYLYNHSQLRERIETLRTTQANHSTSQRTASTRTNESRDVLLVAKDRRIKELEAENRKLKEDLKGAYGKLYERV